MISESINQKSVSNYPEKLKNTLSFVDFSEAVIPFSFLKKTPKKYIYLGTESIPFREREEEYKSILIQEFLQ